MVPDHNSYTSKVFYSCNLPQTMPCQWSPPEENWVKINVDAHVAMEANRGLGAVIRDSNGTLLAAGVKRVCALWSLDISELAAAVYGMELAIFLGYSYVQHEGDNLNVMKSINSKLTGCSPFFLLYQLHLLVLSLAGFNSSIVGCDNTVAHMVARWKLGSFEKIIYMYPFPQILVTLVSLDLI